MLPIPVEQFSCRAFQTLLHDKFGISDKLNWRSILRPERPDTASSVASRASNVDAPADGGRRGSRLSIRAGGGAGAVSAAAGALL